ncbi:MAG: Stk1 family PASTA domain-containing Ser/Thr kinase [Propionibacteriaceae bacterium]|nr:Stk1 family PASTA domain-containing Ser/Thr kinase [Propionibacteriaceae bacterium]
MTVPPVDNLIGSVLNGRYEIVARINGGGTAVVYRGIDRRLGRTVAIKVIHAALAGDPDYVNRFDREARAAANLSHPNIVAVFDQGMAGDRPYIVMEYVRGQSLRSIIASSAPLPPSLALTYAHEVAKAIAAAHESGVIHRDIKPENVLITNDGSVKVTDFGLAKITTAQTTTASQNVLMGTMSYIAPEIPQSGAATKASDIYSAGVVLYEMLTGKKPHVGEDLSQVLYKHVHEDIPPPSQALSGQARARIPNYVDALVTACTSRNDDHRPPDGRVLEAQIAKARRRLEAGTLDDADLVREFREGITPSEQTPVAPIRPASARVPKPAQPGVRKPANPSATKLERAAENRPKTAAAAKPSSPGGKPSDSRRKLPVIPLVAILASTLVVTGILGWVFIWSWTHVPPVDGMTEQVARTELAAVGLTVAVMQDYSETVPAGQVIRTVPQGESRVKKNSEITVYISKGPERYPMPTVIGLSEEEAKNAILSSHLAVGTISRDWSDTYPEGSVISASEAAGDQLKPNTVIDLSVSKGREPITIESQVGKAQEAATTALTDKGFQVSVTGEEYSVNIPVGSVVSQTPNEGTGHKGDIIELVISKGPRMIEVPGVYYMTRADATKVLTDAGFVVDAQVRNPIGIPLGLASGTEPRAGKFAPEGSTVVLIIV